MIWRRTGKMMSKDYRQASQPSFWCSVRGAVVSNDRDYCRNVCRLACRKGLKDGW